MILGERVSRQTARSLILVTQYRLSDSLARAVLQANATALANTIASINQGSLFFSVVQGAKGVSMISLSHSQYSGRHRRPPGLSKKALCMRRCVPSHQVTRPVCACMCRLLGLCKGRSPDSGVIVPNSLPG